MLKGRNREQVASVVALAVLACSAVGLRVALSAGDHGIYWPDEIYQTLEPAHRLLYGYGLIAWEFIDGARNWAMPGLVAALLWMARLFGADDPASYLTFVRVAFALMAGATCVGIYQLARVLGASPLVSVAASAVFGWAGPLVYFGHRAMSETASALPVVFGFVLAFRAISNASVNANANATQQDAKVLSVGPVTLSRRELVLIAGASLLGLSVLLRLQNGVFCVGLLGILLARRQWRSVLIALAVLTVWAFLFGLLDKLTWESWFHSALKYLQFNLVEGKAANWGTAPFGWYVTTLWKAMGVLWPLLALLALLGFRTAPGLLLTSVAFFLLHSVTPHKELRFLLPMMPLLCALSAVGVTWLSSRFDRIAVPIGATALALLSLGSAVKARSLQFGELGAYERQKPFQNAWDDFGDINRLLLAAHERTDLCGLKLESAHQAWSGGHTYLHRNVPFYAHNGPPRELGHYNYVIAWVDPGAPVGQPAAGGELVAKQGSHGLVKLRDACTPDAAYSWRLP